jgi:hypothetical protein
MSIDFLDDFVKQTKTGGQKVKHYPKEFSNLRLRVSFGQGTLSKIPWVMVIAPDVGTSNGYYPVYLFYKQENILILAYGIGESFEADSWNSEIHSSKQRIDEFIDNPFRYGNSYVCQHYEPIVNGEEVKYLRDGKEVSKKQMTGELDSLVDYYKECMDIDLKDETSVISSGLFYMEQQLEDFIIRNWEETELGKKYDLIYEEGELISQQYRTDIGIMDILAKDKKDGSYVVIELKRKQTSDETIGQVTRYMGWIKKKLGDSEVKGIIVAGKFDEKLDYAQEMTPNIEVFLYQVDFKLNEHKR